MTRRVLVARLDSVGDVLLAGPAVRAVAASGAEVTFLAGPVGAQAARLLPGVDRVRVWECPWIAADAPPVTARSLRRLRRLLRAARPDEAIVLTSFHQSPLPLALQLRLAGVPRITAASVDYAGALLDVRLVPGETLEEDQPEALRALAIADAAGYPPPAGDDGRLAIRRSSSPTDRRMPAGAIVLHPGASAPSRRWPVEQWTRLAALLVDAGHDVAVTGGPDERTLTAAVSQQGRVARDLGGTTSLAALAGILERASVLVCGNTGPAHLAAAAGTPVVSLFSPVVSPVRWAPYGVARVVLGDQDAACRGSRARACPVPGHPCLASVTAEDAVEACLLLAARSPEAVLR